MAFARAIEAAYRRYGRNPAGALHTGQITPSQVSEINGRITARQMETLSGAAMQELDDEALGAFSRRLPWGSYGMLARASITSPAQPGHRPQTLVPPPRAVDGRRCFEGINIR